MPIGIRPINDFAFKKIFGSPENKLALISLLNSILEFADPIADVMIENPFNPKDFENDKISILDVKATDQSGAIYDIEIQLTIFEGLVKRIVYYGCEIYAGQLKSGDDYSKLCPAFSICLIHGKLWKDSAKVHHAFRLTDQETGRKLDGTLEVHTLELGWYNLKESELATASMLDCWLYWLLHAQEYDADDLLKLFPQPPIQLATRTITVIHDVTEDKAMYDAQDRAARDLKWAINASRKEGNIEGKIESCISMIRSLQSILQAPVSSEAELQTMSLEQLESIAASLQDKIRNRLSS